MPPPSTTINEVSTADVALKQLNYTQHEYIKFTDVRKLITDSSQSLLNKITDKEKITLALKSWLIKVDDRVKSLEEKAVSLKKSAK